jgi:hypothetical protein
LHNPPPPIIVQREIYFCENFFNFLKKNPDKNVHAFFGARKHDRANSAKAESTLKSKKIKSHKNFKNINICFDFSASETFFIFYRNNKQQKLKYEKNFRQKKYQP